MPRLTRIAGYIALLAAIYPATASGIETKNSKLRLFGYLTQAYAIAHGPQTLGINEDGTLDYRNAALQVRYETKRNNTFILQLSHSATGDSRFKGEDLDIDWAFYRHSFGNGTQIELGRIPIPYGVFNKIRDAGISLPFYRPPVGIYFEGTYSTETLDGISVSHRFQWADGNWSLDASAYIGDWTRIEAIAPFIYTINRTRANEGVGTQFWLNTPVEGLRFGVATQHYTVTNRRTLQVDPNGDPINNYLFSFDFVADRFVARSEVSFLYLRLPFFRRTFLLGYYGQVGYKFSDRFDVFLQFDKIINKNDTFTNSVFRIDPYSQDLGISFGYRPKSSILLRLELHSTKGSFYDELPADGILPGTSDYGILSASFSF